ncbi:hypothetical protein ACFSKM_26265 [Ancylobacter dichloromethanicus]
MAVATLEGDAGPDVDRTSLKTKLRRAERVNRARSFSLVAPLLLFVLAVFALPIGLMLLRSVENTEVRDSLPKTMAALGEWDGKATPGEGVFAAFAEDLVQTQKDRTTALVGKRINYEVPGARSRFLKAGRLIDAGGGGPWKEKAHRRRCRMGRGGILGHHEARRQHAHPLLPAHLARSAAGCQRRRGQELCRLFDFSSTSSSAPSGSACWSPWRRWCWAIRWRTFSPSCRRATPMC